ncbi:MAG: flagellar biosynthetic protein FlhB [Ignavibacteria bacterium]|nr:MAG: flagellar biosynthetic protein FlhB [Ignavibacteria bacterium]KAF0160134.1 MAG: flagellar biosynthetic protein FlhB [Ignavibacteria bacterium]
MADDGKDKTEEPTSKKLSDARDEGRVAKSAEINSLAVFGSGLLMLYITKSSVGSQFSDLAIDLFASLDTLVLNKAMLQTYFVKWALFFFSVTAPVILAIMVVSLASNIAQIGFKFSGKVFQPKLSKFNLFANAKSMLFSSRSTVELFKAVVKLTIIALFTYLILSKLVEDSFQLAELSVEDTLSFMIDASFSLVWKIALFYVLIAGLDFFFQKFKFKKEMMMTKQEVKDEHKQTEGDPEIKQRIRRQMMKMAFKRMMKDVPQADVVVTNPTHYAVAIKYEMTKDGAPKVIAKGMDELAQRIKKIASENNVPLHEDVQLARALYKSCDVGDEIPTKLFKAVAQILAYIYQMKNLKKRRSIV